MQWQRKVQRQRNSQGEWEVFLQQGTVEENIATCKFDKIRNMVAKSATNAVGIITKASEMKQSFCVHHVTRYALILVIGSFVIEDMCAGLLTDFFVIIIGM